MERHVFDTPRNRGVRGFSSCVSRKHGAIALAETFHPRSDIGVHLELRSAPMRPMTITHNNSSRYGHERSETSLLVASLPTRII